MRANWERPPRPLSRFPIRSVGHPEATRKAPLQLSSSSAESESVQLPILGTTPTRGPPPRYTRHQGNDLTSDAKPEQQQGC